MTTFKGISGTVKTNMDTCEICEKTKECWYSTDCTNTYAICNKCAKDLGFEHCHYCGDMREIGHLFILDPRKYKGRGKYCIGCVDDAEDVIQNQYNRITKRKIAPKTKKITARK